MKCIHRLEVEIYEAMTFWTVRLYFREDYFTGFFFPNYLKAKINKISSEIQCTEFGTKTVTSKCNTNELIVIDQPSQKQIVVSCNTSLF